MVRRAHQHGLILKAQPGLVGVEHPGADLPGLGGLVVAADQQGRLPVAGRPARATARATAGVTAQVTARGQLQLQPLRLRPDHVGQLEHRAAGAVVADQPHHGQVRVPDRQRAQVRRVGAAEGVDGLRVVADAGQARALGPQQPDDVGLHRVDVLVLIHEHRVEQAAQRRPGRRVGQRRAPQQQQVVEVDHAVGALVRGVGAEQPAELRGEVGAPREALGHHLDYRGAGVHAARVDVRAGRRPRCPPPGADQVVVGAQRVQHVGDVGRVDDREVGRQRERLRVGPDQPVRDGVKGAPGDPVGGRRVRRVGPGQHVVGGPAGEGQQQDPAGLSALVTQPGGPRHQRPGLPGARPGQDQQRPAGVGRRRPLLVVEASEDRGLLPRTAWLGI